MRTLVKKAVKTAPIELSVKNYNAVLKQFGPLVDKFSYQFYQDYRTIIDFEDARQEVLMCLYRCLSKYSPKQYKFITYFHAAFKRMRSRYYFSYFHDVNILINKDSTGMASDGKRVICDEDVDISKSEERFVDDSYKKEDIRSQLTSESVIIYDVYMKHFKISKWLIAKELDCTRPEAHKMYDKFKKELQKFRDGEYNKPSDGKK